MFLDYFGEDSILDREESGHAHVVFLLDFGLNAHPKRHPRDYLQDDAAEAPDVDGPGVFVLLHFGQHLLVVFQLVLEEDVVENFRRHVFGGRHGELL